MKLSEMQEILKDISEQTEKFESYIYTVMRKIDRPELMDFIIDDADYVNAILDMQKKVEELINLCQI